MYKRARGIANLRFVTVLEAFIISSAVLFALGQHSSLAGDQACETRGLTLPRTVRVGPGVDRELVVSAMGEWNTFYGAVFVEASPNKAADITVEAANATWVTIPCKGTAAVVHVGPDRYPGELDYWMTHEFGHTLGFSDHIRSFDDPSRYFNPGYCPDDGYDGIMSYCTPRERWFGPDDLALMQRLFPRRSSALPFRGGIGVIARDGR
jgi:hypothetical protein